MSAPLNVSSPSCFLLLPHKPRTDWWVRVIRGRKWTTGLLPELARVSFQCRSRKELSPKKWHIRHVDTHGRSSALNNVRSHLNYISSINSVHKRADRHERSGKRYSIVHTGAAETAEIEKRRKKTRKKRRREKENNFGAFRTSMRRRLTSRIGLVQVEGLCMYNVNVMDLRLLDRAVNTADGWQQERERQRERWWWYVDKKWRGRDITRHGRRRNRDSTCHAICFLSKITVIASSLSW